MNQRIQFVLVALAIICITGSVHAQTVRKGTVTGTLISATRSASYTTSAILYTAPDATRGHAIIQKICSNNHGFGVELSGSTLGSLPIATSHDGINCVDYNPGLVLPPDEVLTITDNRNDAEDFIVMLVGVLSRR